MNKKPILAVIMLLMIPLIAITILPVQAWNPTDGTPADTKFEEFGPRANKLLIKLYETSEAEWDSLGRGEIDMTDWPLTKSYYQSFTTPPKSADIFVNYYGAEFGLRLLDVNWDNDVNKRPRWNKPQDPAYPNEAYPNPCSQENFRKALWYLHDKPTWLPTIIGAGFYYDAYTVVPPSQGAYSLPMANPYPYSTADAIAQLMSDLDGGGKPDFPIGPDGWRYWDRNNNGAKDSGEDVNIKFMIRSDDNLRLAVGDLLANNMEQAGVKIKVTRIYGPVAVAREWHMLGKKVHLYTAGWSLGVDPDHVVLWHKNYYWHPGSCSNTCFVNDPLLNEYADKVQYANNAAEALTYCHLFQQRFAAVAAAVPWWVAAGNDAVRRRYSGGNNEAAVTPDDGENAYRGQYWDGVVCVPGYGTDSFFSLLNNHPRGYERGTGSMTIRWAYKTAELRSLNPVYAEWVWEWNTLGLIYDSLLLRNPYNLAEMRPWLAESFVTTTYEHPVYGTCTKVVFTLRPDATWFDGTPITTADAYYTFVELDDDLAARNLPPPWWYSSIADILSFSILDAYNFEVLLDVKSVFATMWPGGNVILPMHIWKPIVETGAVEVVSPDPNLIGSGAYRFGEYVGYSHVLMYANEPGLAVKTNLDGSKSVTSPQGYFRYEPYSCPGTMDGTTRAKVDYYTQPHTLDWTHTNEWYGGPITIDITQIINDVPGTPYTVTLQAKGTAGDTLDETYTGPIVGKVKIKCEIEITWSTGSIEYLGVFWGTIKEDIAGSTYYDDIGLAAYPYKSYLPTPDIKVDIRDVALAALAFGAYPGHTRWATVADINSDYKVDIRDIAAIAIKFGWIG